MVREKTVGIFLNVSRSRKNNFRAIERGDIVYEDERKIEIEYVLKCGKEILDEHPELYEKTYQEVLNVLDDGTRERIRDR